VDFFQFLNIIFFSLRPNISNMVNTAIRAETSIPIPSRDLKKNEDIKYLLNKKGRDFQPSP